MPVNMANINSFALSISQQQILEVEKTVNVSGILGASDYGFAYNLIELRNMVNG